MMMIIIITVIIVICRFLVIFHCINNMGWEWSSYKTLLSNTNLLEVIFTWRWKKHFKFLYKLICSVFHTENSREIVWSTSDEAIAKVTRSLQGILLHYSLQSSQPVWSFPSEGERHQIEHQQRRIKTCLGC